MMVARARGSSPGCVVSELNMTSMPQTLSRGPTMQQPCLPNLARTLG